MKNKVDLIGNLGKDAEVKKFDSGKSVINLTVATTEKWKDKNSEKQEKVTWHDCQWWADLDKLVPFLTKGSLVNVLGRIEKGTYEKEVKGEKVIIPTCEIVVEELILLHSTKPKE